MRTFDNRSKAFIDSPLIHKDREEASITESAKFLKKIGGNPPEELICECRFALLTFTSYIPSILKKLPDIKTIKRYRNLSFYRYKEALFCLAHSTMGAPAAVMVLEELRLFNFPMLVAIGSAGSISHQQDLGELILVTKALRDEGTSYHYLPPENFAHPHRETVQKLKTLMKRENIEFNEGTSWTTDAIYRETPSQIRHNRKSHGTNTVEMESSALYACAQYYSLPLVSLLFISDFITENGWQMEFTNKKLHSTMTATTHSLIKALCYCENPM